MPFPPRLAESIRQFFAGVTAAWGSFVDKVQEKAAELRVLAGSVMGGPAKGLPQGKRRLIVMGSIGICAVFLLIITGTLLLTGGGREERKPEVRKQAAARQGLISPDDVFLPEEPDFIPGVLLEREQRTMWAADDVESLWQDPLKGGEEPWRNQIEKTIDEIMESVP